MAEGDDEFGMQEDTSIMGVFPLPTIHTHRSLILHATGKSTADMGCPLFMACYCLIAEVAAG